MCHMLQCLQSINMSLHDLLHFCWKHVFCRDKIILGGDEEPQRSKMECRGELTNLDMNSWFWAILHEFIWVHKKCFHNQFNFIWYVVILLKLHFIGSLKLILNSCYMVVLKLQRFIVVGRKKNIRLEDDVTIICYLFLKWL